MKILITGAAGFIGFHLIERLASRGDEVVGIDNINDYYDQRVKYGRLAWSGIDEAAIEYGKPVQSSKYPNYRFVKLNLEDKEGIDQLFKTEKFDALCNLAAQAGVRYSLTNPGSYVSSNIVGFVNLLEAARHNSLGNFCYASSSSVYGLNERQPFSVHHNVDHPVSLYAASKKSNELMAHTYSHLFGIPTTGLRFFTVTAPGGGPTWRSSSSPKPRSKAARSMCSTTATCSATSPTSTTSSRASCGCSTIPPSRTRTGAARPPIPARRPRRTASITSATTSRSA